VHPRRDRLRPRRRRDEAGGRRRERAALAGRGFLVITHYQRLLDHIKPDVVHIMADGRIVKTGGPELALEVEKNGYADILAEVA
jgi:Fe-S cluster assembly ATPase SufC